MYILLITTGGGGGGGGSFGLCFNAINFFFAVGDCGSLLDPTNGQVSFTATTEGSEANYTCDTGYDHVGDSIRTCQSDEQWSGSEPNCDRKCIPFICFHSLSEKTTLYNCITIASPKV